MTNPNDKTSAADAAELIIPIGDMKWAQVLPMLIAAIEDGTPAGVRMAKDYLAQMAAAADLAGMAMSAIMSAGSRGLDLDADIQAAISQAKHNSTRRGH
jgi:hypothetical protein